MLFLRALIPLIWALGYVEPITLLTNGNVYTVNSAQPTAEAIAVGDDGTILAVGSNSEITSAYTGTIIDMGGRLVLPGFQDAHLHVVEAGVFSNICFVPPNPAINNLPSFLGTQCTFGDQGWIVGAGVSISSMIDRFEAGESSPLSVLDNAYPSTPVLILDDLGHGAIANSVALNSVGYTSSSSDPPGGILYRDSSNNLIGIVLENAQQKLREGAFPNTSTNQDTAYLALLNALPTLAANGITSVSDAGGFWLQAQTEAWSRAEDNGLLTVRASNALYVYPDVDIDTQLSDLTSRYSNDASKLVKFNHAKIYVDGILSLGTGAVDSDYTVTYISNSLGFEYFGDASTLNNVATTLASNGFQLHFHVTGDRGAHLALDAIEAAQGAASNSGPHRLTHNFLVRTDEYSRFASLGAFADFQVASTTVTQDYIDFITSILDSERASRIIPSLEVYDAAGSVVISSDWDADELSPLSKIEILLTRVDGRSFPDVATVIPLMTSNPARLLNTNTGSIEVGKLADIIALDRNIFDIPVNSISQAQVDFTMFNGNVIYNQMGVCFSPYVTVNVKGRGKVLMEDIAVGDKVMTRTGAYKTVYTMDHRDSTASTHYVQIHTELDENPLEITPRHMLFVKGKSHPVPSSTVKIGDYVETINGVQKVIDITFIMRNGVYNPLTEDGTIVVDGIIASTYSSYDSTSEYVEIAGFNLLPIHTVIHMASVPYRQFCMVVSLSLCDQHNGRAFSGKFLQNVYDYGRQQHVFVQFMIFFVFVLFFFIVRLVMSQYGFFAFILVMAWLGHCWLRTPQHEQRKKKI